jgi:hypothetical protein
MLINPNSLWVGSINGIHAVFDPQIQVDQSRWVLLYIINQENVVAYRRISARADAKKHTSTHPQFEIYKQKYSDWLTAKSVEEIEALKHDLRRKDAAALADIARIEVMHRKHLSIDDHSYRGISEPTNAFNIRDSICFNCHSKVGSHLNLKCNACGWMICEKCGTCGCRYHIAKQSDIY